MVTQNEKICSALSYILIGIIWFFVDEKMRKSSFTKFHVQQGLTLLVVSILCNVISMMLPFIGMFVNSVFGVLVLIWFIIGVINSFEGKKKELFWIGQFGKKFNI